MPDGSFPVINGGIDVSGYTNQYNTEAKTITISQGGASAGYVNWVNSKFWAGAHCYIVTPKKGYNKRFLYHFIKFKEYDFMNSKQGAGIPGLNRTVVLKTEMPKADEAKQQQIADTLDKFTSMIENIDEEIELRQKQYEEYRNKLLSFSENDESVEWKKLGEVCEKVSNIKWNEKSPSSEYQYIDLSSVSIDNHKIVATTSINKLSAPSRAQQIVKCGDILLGTTRPTLKRYCLVSGSYNNQICSTGYCVIRPNKASVKWIYYNITHNRFWDYCEVMQRGANYPTISNSDTFAYTIPIPSLSRQQEIVDILDKFELVIVNLKEERELRRQQYEYYREKLLTF